MLVFVVEFVKYPEPWITVGLHGFENVVDGFCGSGEPRKIACNCLAKLNCIVTNRKVEAAGFGGVAAMRLKNLVREVVETGAKILKDALN